MHAIEINDPYSTTLAFFPAWMFPTNFSQATGPANYTTRLRIGDQHLLKLQILIIIQQ